MDSARCQQIFEAFRSLLEVPSADRATRLEALAAGDENLRRHVAELLAAAEKSALDAFSEERLARQDWRPDREVPQTEHPERIGPYRILRLIGEGGMGRVFEAEQDVPRRRVALKLLASGAGSEPLRRRFRLEADVLARLQHPGIAPIFEYGELDGPHGLQPWFAMELVDGVDLRTWAEREALSAERRLDLVARVADAVEHAHAKGVIHRDLKPDNVLVDREGRPRELDFGIACVLDDSTLRRTTVTCGSSASNASWRSTLSSRGPSPHSWPRRAPTAKLSSRLGGPACCTGSARAIIARTPPQAVERAGA